MAHVVAGDGALQRFMIALVFELGRVDAYYDEIVTEVLFEGPEFVEDVQAVDAAERPEIEEDDLALEGF